MLSVTSFALTGIVNLLPFSLYEEIKGDFKTNPLDCSAHMSILQLLLPGDSDVIQVELSKTGNAIVNGRVVLTFQDELHEEFAFSGFPGSMRTMKVTNYHYKAG